MFRNKIVLVLFLALFMSFAVMAYDCCDLEIWFDEAKANGDHAAVIEIAMEMIREGC